VPGAGLADQRVLGRLQGAAAVRKAASISLPARRYGSLTCLRLASASFSMLRTSASIVLAARSSSSQVITNASAWVCSSAPRAAIAATSAL